MAIILRMPLRSLALPLLKPKKVRSFIPKDTMVSMKKLTFESKEMEQKTSMEQLASREKKMGPTQQ